MNTSFKVRINSMYMKPDGFLGGFLVFLSPISLFLGFYFGT